jgi:FMN phosphatase YigB (HAD superfamily)
MNAIAPVVFLIDVDDTLLDGDRFVADLQAQLKHSFGNAGAEYYWSIFETIRQELSYVDYLGALERYRIDNPHDQNCLEVTTFLLNYPFPSRLFPGSLNVIKQLQTWGPTSILSDGDIVYQVRKIEISGLFDALKGRVLIYIHKEKELDEVEKLYPADHYVLIDDKINILTAAKKIWGSRLTTIFPRQGHYAHDPKILAANPPADITIQAIGDLLRYDLPTLIQAGRASGSTLTPKSPR